MHAKVFHDGSATIYVILVRMLLMAFANEIFCDYTKWWVIQMFYRLKRQFVFMFFGSIFWTSVSEAKPCAVLYEHPHREGAAWEIEDGTDSQNISDAMIERREWCGSVRGYCKGRDRSWNDSVSSIYVSRSCSLTTWVDQDFNGTKVIFEGIFFGTTFGTIPIDDQLTSFKCSCSDPLTSDIGGPSTFYN